MRVREVSAVLLLSLVSAASVCRAGELRADQDDADLHAIARVGQRVAWVVGDRGVAWSRWRWTWSSSGGCAVGRITRRRKSARNPLAGNPHERFEVEPEGVEVTTSIQPNA